MNSIKPRTVRVWYRVHKWTSLICTVVILMACVTGLPLIFVDELNPILQQHVKPASFPPDAPMANLDSMIAEAQRRFPSLHPFAMWWDDDEPRIFVSMSPISNPTNNDTRLTVFDAHTGRVLEMPKPGVNFMGYVLRLHRELFLGTTGDFVIAVMGLSFVASLVSGVLVYGPFMRRLDFGTYRHDRSRRTRWFDLHNLLGIVIVSWALIVGATGIMNALSDQLLGLWRAQTMPQILAPYRGKPMPTRHGSLDAAVKEVAAALPWAEQASILFPNPVLGSPRHYIIWSLGKSPITSRLATPALVDVETGKLTLTNGMPWYLRTLEVSRPLHFGDYGGLPLKIIWALFDVALIVVLLSGVYLWLSRHKAPVEKELDRLVRLEKLEAEQTPAAGVLAR